jgi:osmotically inducible protein OsmC
MTQLEKERTETKTEKLLYTAKVHTSGGRDGAARSDDGRIDVKFSLPGAPGTGTNPEQMFAAGWSACLLSAMQIAARQMKIAFPADTADDVEVDLNLADGGYFLRARHNISLPGLDRTAAQALIDAGRQTCPYSKAVHGNIDATYNLV